jgi:hypothetical protein
MPFVVQNHLVVREVGTPWLGSLVDEGLGSDKTVVLLQQADESARELATRLGHRVRAIRRGREQLHSAVMACNNERDAQTQKMRYRIARRMMRSMRGPARLVIVVEKGNRALHSIVHMARRLMRDAGNVVLSVQCGPELIAV